MSPPRSIIPTHHETGMSMVIEIDGDALDLGVLEQVARGEAEVALTAAGRERIRRRVRWWSGRWRRGGWSTA
jgi:hypothetical protein